MSDDQVAESATDETVEDQHAAETESTDEPDLQARYETLLANSRKWEKRAKDNDKAATRLKEIEDSERSESEKLQARAEAAEQRANELEARTLRSEVATAKGLTASQAKRLQGSTLEELEADADDLLSAFPKAPPVVGSADGGARSSAPSLAAMSDADLDRLVSRK